MIDYLLAITDIQEFLLRYERGISDPERLMVIRDIQHHLAEMYRIEELNLDPYNRNYGGTE